MADNYVQTALSIDSVTDAEAQWLHEVLSENFEDQDPGEIRKYLNDNYGLVLDDDVSTEDTLVSLQEGYMEWPGFDYSLDDGIAYFHVDGDGNLELIGNILSAFLKKFRPSEVLSYSWANTCSKMRPDEFGGGACVVSSKRVEYLNTYGWISETEKKMKEEL